VFHWELTVKLILIYFNAFEDLNLKLFY